MYKAIRAGDKRKAKSVQKLILKSLAARMLAVRQVTRASFAGGNLRQALLHALNAGKRTPGVDGKASLTFFERLNLTLWLRNHYNNWQHQKLREIPIPKKDGKTRILKVPTIADRACLCLVKFAMEPAHEATSHSKSYGFRPGRATHDAQKQLFNNLSSVKNGIKKRVLELDIEKCFDRINHTSIMERLTAPLGIKTGIFRCLKAGVNPEYPEQGTPQGGVVSPLLANIALNGIESLHKYKIGGETVEPTVRYADDMVVILRPQDDAYAILEKISQFLVERGMNVSQKKTKLTAATDGFDFLGWNFKVQSNGKFKSVPSEDNFKAIVRR